MKLFSWAHRKLLPSTSLHKNQHNKDADRLFEISTPNLTCGEQSRVSRDAHAEVLTIGTLGLGSLLSMNNNGEEEEEEEEEDEELEEEEEEEEEEAHNVSPIARSPSPNRELMSSNRASTSSNRASISSNRESVSSIDIQKLQEELQKILYFKLGQEHKGDINKLDGSKAKAKKHRRDKHAYINDMNVKQISNGDGKSHVPSERGSMRGMLPLHNFLEMPMDNNNNSARPPYKMLSKKQYLLLMQSLKSKFLHYTSPTRVKLSPSLFEKLVKLNLKRDLQHGSTMDKMLNLLRKVMNKRPHGKRRKVQEGNNYENDQERCTNEEEEGEEERLKWAVAKSCKGSERFINYITSTLAQDDMDNTSLIQNQHQLHHDQHQFHCEEGGNLQLMLATSPSLDNECWIKTDDEYLVLEL